jgi:hypothetical protein
MDNLYCSEGYSGPAVRRGIAESGYNVGMVRAEHVLDSWKAIPQDTVAAVEDFPAAEFQFRPTPELAAQPDEFFGRMVIRFDGQKVTRLEMIQSIEEHELTQRAQLFVYLRLTGKIEQLANAHNCRITVISGGI